MPKFCKDCKYRDDSFGPSFERCARTFNAGAAQYLVSGERKWAMSYCTSERMNEAGCGADAKLFEAKA